MSDIIDFTTYRKGFYTMEKFSDLLEKLKKYKEEDHIYTLKEIDNIAYEILGKLDYYSKKSATPIVKIVKEFDFKTYKEELGKNYSGDIYINGETADKYGHDKVILVNEKDELYHQRFVIAHELAHYLFDYLGNVEYSDLSLRFSDTYHRNHHETISERRANRFAAAILMPEDVFVEQYNIAKAEDNNRIFILMYLSRFFETTIDSIERRIAEVLE